MRKTAFLSAFLLAILTFALPALAAPAHRAVFVVGQNIYTVDGQARIMDTAPYIKDGRMFVPIRYVAQAVGVAPQDILYTEGKVTLLKNNKVVQLTIGSNTMLINGAAVNMDVAAEIANGRTMLPFRWVALAFGAMVKWDEAARTVIIEEPDSAGSGGRGDSGRSSPDAGSENGAEIVLRKTPVEVIPPVKYPSSVNTVSRDFQWRYGDTIYRWHVEIPAELLNWDRRVVETVNTFYSSDGITQTILFSSVPDNLKRLIASCSESAKGNFVPWVDEDLNYTYAGILAERLFGQAQADGYDYFHAAEFVQSFVGGAIPYRQTPVPQLPVQTLVDAGDCKDKSILLAAILKNMGYRTALLIYPPPPGQQVGHMAVGIAFRDDEITVDRLLSYYLYNGTRYYFAETTEPNWLIGQISDEKLEKEGYVYPVN